MKKTLILLLSLVMFTSISCGDETLNFINGSSDATVTRPNTDENSNQEPGVKDQEQDQLQVPDSKQDKDADIDNLNNEEDLSGLQDELSDYLIHLSQIRSSTPSQGARVLQDVVGHYFSGAACMAYTNYYSSDPDTYAHEATHGLNACIRNNYNNTGEVVNGFYLLEGNAIVVREPHIKKSQVARYIPDTLKNMDGTKRYNTYIVGQTSFESNPLYIFDEWSAYTNGALEAIDQFKTKNYQTSAILLGGGALEFMMYATSLGLAISELDPGYFKREPRFIPLYKYLVEKAVIQILQGGASYPKVVDQSMVNYFEKFKTDSSAEKLRNFVRTYIGTGWAKKVLDI